MPIWNEKVMTWKCFLLYWHSCEGNPSQTTKAELFVSMAYIICWSTVNLCCQWLDTSYSLSFVTGVVIQLLYIHFIHPNLRSRRGTTDLGRGYYTNFSHSVINERILTHTRPRDMARSRPPFWTYSFAAWKWVNMDGNWRNFDGNISSYV